MRSVPGSQEATSEYLIPKFPVDFITDTSEYIDIIFYEKRLYVLSRERKHQTLNRVVVFGQKTCNAPHMVVLYAFSGTRYMRENSEFGLPIAGMGLW